MATLTEAGEPKRYPTIRILANSNVEVEQSGHVRR